MFILPKKCGAVQWGEQPRDVRPGHTESNRVLWAAGQKPRRLLLRSDGLFLARAQNMDRFSHGSLGGFH